ncbi:MAG: 4-alpha-glucanotransferase [Thiotrichales bacterium]|nr:MAG: 4-alpha-glucanotransferase [Thiotrichales bacterium]
MKSQDFYDRRAGVLLHPTSLPSRVLDRDVERWLGLLDAAGFSVWQVLPLGEPQGGLSPYQCISAFAMNPALLGDFPTLDKTVPGYIEFCASNHEWLYDYTLFKVLKQMYDDAPWFEWPDEWKYRQPHAMQRAFHDFKDYVAELSWEQYQLFVRWREIKQKANDKGISLFGDIPLFVAHDSADVWAHPEQFLLDEQGSMTVVAGVPPDYYSETGQRWGNPHYNWEVMRQENYAWWLSRINHHLQEFDLLRIDHFRGLESAWVIDAACETAVDGYWHRMPGDELLTKINEDAGHLPIVAEDLGIITPEVTALRKKHNLPGMSVLQFGFDEHADNPHKPNNIHQDSVVYTGTHDNDTTKGWYQGLDLDVKNDILQTLRIHSSGDHADPEGEGTANLVVDKLIDNAMNSQASLCMIPMQDCLHLGSEARMNTPGTIEGNWLWSFSWEQIHDDIAADMKLRIETANRLAR